MKPDEAGADEALRQTLRTGLHSTNDSREALQARVLAQWRQRHAPLSAEARLASAGGQGWPVSRPRRWLGAAALAASLLLALAWCGRPDPALDELMQLDVLSQIAIGEL